MADTEVAISASKSTGKKKVRGKSTFDPNAVHTKTNTWNIPYCSMCARHVTVATVGAKLGWTLAGLSLVAGGLAWWSTQSPNVGIPVGIAGLVGSMLIAGAFMVLAWRMCSSECVKVRHAVAYMGWHGTLHQFKIASQDFAFAFMLANQKKLVNLSPEATRLLATIDKKPNAPRSPKRDMT